MRTSGKRMLAAIAAAVFVAGFGADLAQAANAVISGDLRQYNAVTITFDGPASSEDATPNPFTDYRLSVTFTQGQRKVVVCGYYAADGKAGEMGSAAGNKWRVHFVPETQGRWSYVASFRTGPGVAIADDAGPGSPAGFDGAAGELTIGPSDNSATDLRARGFLRHDANSHYLRFSGSGEYFIKGGADSPENLLGYADFDDTFHTGKKGDAKRPSEADASKNLHSYKPHLGDWRNGNPTWRGGKGKGLIGALNYLASKGMNSVYFLTYNLDGGDGKDVWPWTTPTERQRFDCSKLDQWEVVFSHMDRLGLMMHVITQETENDQGLDRGELGPQRRLYYRELIARFGHHLAVTWNLGEENTNTDAQRKAFAAYIRRLDAARHPIVVHTYPGKYEAVYGPLLGLADFDGPSLQMGNMKATHDETLKWVSRSAAAGRKWFVSLDEIGPANAGVLPDKDDPAHDSVRRWVLWGNLMAGGAGCEWYFGYKYPNNDLTCEDWRSRDAMWNQTRFALEFFRKYLPFAEMKCCDDLTSAKDDYCFAAEGKAYAVYLPNGEATTIKLPAGVYTVAWYNPRADRGLLGGSVSKLTGPGEPSLGTPPGEPGKDWVVLIRAAGK